MKALILIVGTIVIVIIVTLFGLNRQVIDNNYTPDLKPKQSRLSAESNPIFIPKISDPKLKELNKTQPIQNTSIERSSLPLPLRKALQERLKNNTSSEGLIEKVNPDGSVSVDLKGRFQHVPVAIMGEDGKITVKEFYTAPKDSKSN